MFGETPTENLMLFFLEQYPKEIKQLGIDSDNFGYVPLTSLESGGECLCPDISGISVEDFSLLGKGDPFQRAFFGRNVSGIAQVLGISEYGDFVKVSCKGEIFFMSPTAHVIVAREA